MNRKILLFLCLLCFSCKGNNPNIIAKFPQDQDLERKQNAGNMFGNKDGIILFEDKKDTSANNKKNSETLWNRTISVVSNILPISIVDDKSGLISTDWGNINKISGNDDLYKINIIVKNNIISRENIIISIFKKNSNGQDSKDEIVEKRIENLIFN